MQLSHTRRGAVGDVRRPESGVVRGAGPGAARWPQQAGLRALADEHLSVPSDKGANAGLKVASLVAGMVAGADSIDDMALLRHGGDGHGSSIGRTHRRRWGRSCASSRFGHVRQLDAVAVPVPDRAGRPDPAASPVIDGRPVLVDIDDTIIEVHGHGQAGCRVRLLRGPRAERAARHGQHRRRRAGDRRPTAAQGLVRIPPRSAPGWSPTPWPPLTARTACTAADRAGAAPSAGAG